MATNENIKRLAGAKNSLQTIAVPPIPRISDAAIARVPELAVWNEQMEAWRNQFAAFLKQQLETIRDT